MYYWMGINRKSGNQCHRGPEEECTDRGHQDYKGPWYLWKLARKPGRLSTRARGRALEDNLRRKLGDSSVGPLAQSKNFGLHSTYERKTLGSWWQAEPSIDLYFKRALSKRKEKDIIFILSFAKIIIFPVPTFTCFYQNLSKAENVLHSGVENGDRVKQNCLVTLESVLIPPTKTIWVLVMFLQGNGS